MQCIGEGNDDNRNGVKDSEENEESNNNNRKNDNGKSSRTVTRATPRL